MNDMQQIADNYVHRHPSMRAQLERLLGPYFLLIERLRQRAAEGELSKADVKLLANQRATAGMMGATLLGMSALATAQEDWEGKIWPYLVQMQQSGQPAPELGDALLEAAASSAAASTAAGKPCR